MVPTYKVYWYYNYTSIIIITILVSICKSTAVKYARRSVVDVVESQIFLSKFRSMSLSPSRVTYQGRYRRIVKLLPVRSRSSFRIRTRNTGPRVRATRVCILHIQSLDEENVFRITCEYASTIISILRRGEIISKLNHVCVNAPYGSRRRRLVVPPYYIIYLIPIMFIYI